MYTMKGYLLVLLFAFQCLLVVELSSANRHLPATTAPYGNCGKKYDNQTCPNDECCSEWGGCGTTKPFCAPPGCQPAYGKCWSSPPPPTTPPPPYIYGNCGPNYYNQSCPDGECCSEWGGCGITKLYCAYPHCQSEYDICWPNPPSPTPAPEYSDQVADDSHSLIRKAFDSLGLLNPF